MAERLRVGVTETPKDRVAEAVADALRDCGMEPVRLGVDTLLADIGIHRCDVIFPLPPQGSRREQIWLCHRLDLVGVPYVGRDARAQHLALNKFAAGRRLRSYGVRTPRRWLIQSLEDPLPGFPYPVIVKPCWEGSSAGIWPDSVASDADEVTFLIRRVMEKLDQPAIVEEFLPGREFSVGVAGSEVLPVLEVDVASIRAHGPFLSAQAKSEHLAVNICPANIDQALEEELSQLALRSVRAIGCTGAARVDIRLDFQKDRGGRPHVLEVNGMPGLDPDHSDIPRMARAAGWSYADLIWRLVEDARIECALSRGVG